MRRLATALVLAPTALLAACPPPSASPGPAVEPLPVADAGAARPPAPPPSSAPSASAPKPITVDCGQKLDLARGCATDADCGVFEAPVCCGHVPAYGVRAADAKRANAACGPRDCSVLSCPFGGMITDDGVTGVDPASVVARCVAGACASRAR